MEHSMIFDLLVTFVCPFSSMVRAWRMEKYLREHIASLPRTDRLLLSVEPIPVSLFLDEVMLSTLVGRGQSRGVDSRCITKLLFFQSDCSRRSQYESIVLDCKFPSSEETFHLQVERTHGEEADSGEAHTEPGTPTTTHSSPLLSSSSEPARQLVSLLEGWDPAKDQIHRLASLESLKLQPTAVYTPPTPIPLLEAACLLHILHEEATDYVLLKHQCFRLATAVRAILEHRHGPSGEGTHQQSHPGMPDTLLAPSGTGRCRSFQIASLTAEEVEQLSEKLDVELASLIQEVSWTQFRMDRL
jgi:hypothetical protein